MADNQPGQQPVINQLLEEAKRLAGFKNSNQVAKQFSIIRHGTDSESERYYSAVRKIEKNASVAGWDSVRDYFLACDIDIEMLLRISLAAKRGN